MIRILVVAHSRCWRQARRGNSGGRPSLQLAVAGCAALSLAGCGSPPAGDEAAIIRATLALLASDRPAGAPALCVDSRPRGEPLAIYRTMRINSEPDERQWREPVPLRGEPQVAGRELFDDATDRKTLRIPEPDDAAQPLTREEQAGLETAARTLSLDGQSRGFTLDGSVAPSGMTVRWWLLNRLRGGCDRTIVLSRLVHDTRTGFITVTVDHWGTTYALKRDGSGWRVDAQWDSWLY